MADHVRILAGLAGVAALATAGTIIALTGTGPDTAETATIILDGDPLELDALAGPAPVAAQATWRGQPVVVLKLAEALGPSLPVPGEPGAIVVFVATSTYMGCRVEPITNDGAMLLRDVCHHGTWDPSRGGSPQDGPAPAALTQLQPALSRQPDGLLVIEATGK